MFVRLRVSSTNLDWVRDGVNWYTSYQVPGGPHLYEPITIAEPQVPSDVLRPWAARAQVAARHINPYFCPTKGFMQWVVSRYRTNRLVSMCGSLRDALLSCV